MHELDLGHPAQRRLVEDLLGWGDRRPIVPAGLVDDLVDRLEHGLATLALTPAVDSARGGRFVVTKRVLERLACDGLQADPAPYHHGWASARGQLAHLAIARDLDGNRADAPHQLVDALWREEASRRPGDPASLSRWLNGLSAADGRQLREDVAELLEDFREVWPRLPSTSVVARPERRLEVALAGGRVLLRGVPDLVLDSPIRDARARALVVDVKTGLPRPVEDRRELRFYALLVALADGRPPWRWATYYVPEGRTDREDLDAELLLATADRVLEVVGQLVRIATADSVDIRAGTWCHDCGRASTCPQSAARAHPA